MIGSIANIFNIILYQPLLNVLVLLYLYLPGSDFGLAVISLTIIIKLILYPLGVKSIRSQRDLAALQPKIKELQNKYKDNKEQQTKEIMSLYKTEGINPFSGCLPLLIQLPILLALYRVFWVSFDASQAHLLYSFVKVPEVFNTTFLGIVDLSSPNIILAILAGVFQFIQIKTSMPKIKPGKSLNTSEKMQKQMQFFMPAFMVIILLNLPSAIGLYWVTTTIFTIGQQYMIFKKINIEKQEGLK